MDDAITYRRDLDGLRPELITGFFVGWPRHPSPEKHCAILAGSHRVALAWHGGRVVGFANAIGDGTYCAYIPLLEVLPAYRKRGIGGRLIGELLDQLADCYAVDVCCDEAVAGFYARLRFQRVVGMVHRNYARQA